MEVKKRVMNCLEENGIEVCKDGTFNELESVEFISMVVSLEEEFMIEFPDEYLLTYKLTNVNIICNVIMGLINGKC